MAAKRRTRRAKNSKTTRLLTTSTTTRLLLPTSQLPLKSLPLKLPLRSQRKRRTRRTWTILTQSASSTAVRPPTLAIHHMQLLPLDSPMSKQIVAILLIWAANTATDLTSITALDLKDGTSAKSAAPVVVQTLKWSAATRVPNHGTPATLSVTNFKSYSIILKIRGNEVYTEPHHVHTTL